MTKVFLISPVRNANPAVTEAVHAYVASLESSGHAVHWPTRDTDQADPIGLRICRDNGRAIVDADEVHVWYDPSSQGSVFDLGMLFMLREVLGEHRRVVVANPTDIAPTDGKSFPNVLLALADGRTVDEVLAALRSAADAVERGES